MTPSKDSRSSAATAAGIALVVVGVWWLAWALVPEWLRTIGTQVLGALVLIALGVLVVVAARRGTFNASYTGTRLHRSRSDRWIGGVLGGLGAYLGIEPLIPRILVLVLTLLGQGVLVLAYIVLWVLVPEEPPFAATVVPPVVTDPAPAEAGTSEPVQSPPSEDAHDE
jgi:phage shock protein PspC (stress-responsive transcriptional regulator)